MAKQDNSMYATGGAGGNNNASTEEKPKKPIKMYIIIGAIVLLIILTIMANKDKAEKERMALEEAESSASAETTAPKPTEAPLSESEKQQLRFIEKWGEPPAGFRWKQDGTLVAISDADMTGEEVVYAFLRSLSTLDMANASKYASGSTVVKSYDRFFDADAVQTYSTQFLRRMYANVLTSIEIEDVIRQATFADGRYVFTMELSVLDLSNKEFWKDDAEEMFSTIYTYNRTEADKIKAQQYVYDKILAYYESGEAQKHKVQVEIVLDKVSLGGWLVSNDLGLDTVCRYTDGNTVYSYIMDEYQGWYEQKRRNGEL